MTSALRARSATPRTANTRSSRSDRLDEVLSQLEDLILQEGFGNLTVDSLAGRLQCSKTTLYAIAPSKEQLVQTALKRFFRDAAAKVEAAVADVSDPVERISAYLAAVGSAMRHMSPVCYEDMIRMPTTRDIYDVNSRAAARRVHEMIRDGIDRDVFRAVHAQFVGEAVSLLIEGIQEGSLLQRTGLSNGDAFEELSALVLGALSIDTASSSLPTPARRRSRSR